MSSIAEVKKMQIGLPVMDLKAKIMEVHSRHTGTGQYGDWSIQSVLISDGKDVISVTVGNQDEISQEAKGENVMITSYFNQKKNSWIGATVAAGTKGEKIVKLSKTGTFCIGDIESAKEAEKEAKKPTTSGTTPHKSTLEEAYAKAELLNPTEPTKRVVNDAELEKYRSMAIAYAKDLVSSSKINVDELFKFADTMVTYIKSGNVEIVKTNESDIQNYIKEDEESGIESAEQIPF